MEEVLLQGGGLLSQGFGSLMHLVFEFGAGVEGSIGAACCLPPHGSEPEESATVWRTGPCVY